MCQGDSQAIMNSTQAQMQRVEGPFLAAGNPSRWEEVARIWSRTGAACMAAFQELGKVSCFSELSVAARGMSRAKAKGWGAWATLTEATHDDLWVGTN